ncbi:MAG: hypothetical protein ACOYIF_02635 [Acetivibrionales bacterium]
MNSFSSQPSGSMPYTVPPCPGCPPGVTTGQGGLPMNVATGAPPLTPPYTDLLSQMPTGIPGGPALGTAPQMQQRFMQQAQPGMVPGTQPRDTTPIFPWNQPMPVTTESLQYMNGFMRTQIGRRVTIEFLIGTNTLTDRTGTLLAVGANYILINEVETDDILLCDFFSMKFIKFYY